MTDDERKELEDAIGKDWPLKPEPHIFWKASLVAHDMIDSYLQDDTQDRTQPPIARTIWEVAATKIIKFVSSSEHIRVTPNWSEDDIERQKLRLDLALILLH